MPMGLAGSRLWAAVEEPQAMTVLLHAVNRTPVHQGQPTVLRSPLATDQQHVTKLNGIFVQNQDMVLSD